MPHPARTLHREPSPELEDGIVSYTQLTTRPDGADAHRLPPVPRPGRKKPASSLRTRWSAWAVVVLGALCAALLLARYCGVWGAGRSAARTPARAEQAWEAADGPPPGFEYLVHPLGFLPGQDGPAADGYVASDDGSGISPLELANASGSGVVDASRGPTLFCFALTMSDGYEMDLMTMFWKNKASLFACDEYTVYSGEAFELVPSVMTEGIGDTHCEYGGPYNLALNSDIFVRVWQRVIAGSFWRLNDWTVKVDPDCVFLPQRLRDRVRGLDPEASAYINNCDQGLHGPIEVIARKGMLTYALGMNDCVNALSDEFTWGGEDVFLRHCWNRLNVSRVDDFQLLSEDHCMWENPAKNGCVSGKVAFHPFKSADAYSKCLTEAEENPATSSTATTSTTATTSATATATATATTTATTTAAATAASTTTLCDPSVARCDGDGGQ